MFGSATTQTEREGRRGRTLLSLLLIAALASGAGVGGYLLGSASGVDLEAARDAGVAEGERLGTSKGAREGFAQGLKEGRRETFDDAYRLAYRRAYTRAFERAGLEPPIRIKVAELVEDERRE